MRANGERKFVGPALESGSPRNEEHMQKGNGTRKPWQDESGRTLPTAELRVVSRNWPTETWGDYLESIETPQNEIIVGNFDETLRKYARRELEAHLQESVPERNEPHLEPIVRQLPASEQAIIRAMFFDGLSERETSEKLGLSRRQIMTLKAKALRLLRSFSSHFAPNNVHPLRNPNVSVGGFLSQVTNQVAVNQVCQ